LSKPKVSIDRDVFEQFNASSRAIVEILDNSKNLTKKIGTGIVLEQEQIAK